MKFACSECQAKYQIPDDRIVGRKLKIRCRKCGAVISVRGDHTGEHAAAAPESLAPTPAPEALEWHVSLQGEQHGPYLTEQMAGMLRAGQLGWDAHVWHEGYGDWKTADQSDTLVRAVAALGAEQGYETDEAPTRQSVPPGAELQAASGEYAAAPTFGATPRVVYPPGYASPQPEYESHAGGYGGGRVTEQAMTAQRNEDSILFSAKNLQLAASSGSSSPAGNTAATAREGYANTEGSGLIDIRALAALASRGSNGADYGEQQTTPVDPSVGYAAHDDLPPLANHVSTFGRIDSLSPIERPAPRQSYAVPLAIVAGSALVAVAAFSAVYLTRQPAGASAPVAATAAPVVPAAEPAPAAPQPAAAPTPPADEPEQVASAAEPDDSQHEQAAAADSADTHARHAGGAKHERAGKGSVRASLAAGKSKAAAAADKPERAPAASAKQAKAEKEKEAEPEKAADNDKGKKASLGDDLFAEATPASATAEPAQPAKGKEPAKPRSIDDLLDSAVVKHGSSGGGAAAGNLPETPSRDQVKAAMKSVEPKVKACAAGQELSQPSSTVSLTVVGATGRVQGVRVTGNEGPVGSCIARAVRSASFPKFSKSDMTINFPFMLK